jgi:hypothetical protein
MSNLARYFKNLGRRFLDTIKRHLYYNELIESGISIHFEDDIHAIQRFLLRKYVGYYYTGGSKTHSSGIIS